MPLVLATGAPTASGHDYDDVLGKQYEFPLQYRNLVTRGEPFVYYMGRRGAAAGRPIYFGSGVVGDVLPSSRRGQLVAAVHDVEVFGEPIPAKASDGTYLETGSTTQTNWASGVRRISDESLARIVGSAPLHAIPASPTFPATRASHATQAHASALERYSVRVALKMLEAEFGVAAVREMPPGNPGFDILVTRPHNDLHVEVKGTVLPGPVFHLSEGQRKHADLLGSGFRLIVVYDVDVAKDDHQMVSLEGPLDTTKVTLQAAAWIGQVLL